MNHPIVLIGWPQAADFDIPYGLASALALFLTVWLLAFLKRTADQHYRLRSEKEKEDKAAAPADEEDPAEGHARGPQGKPLVLAGLVLFLGPALALAQEATEPAPSLSVGAVVETYFAWNLNRPENGITAFRGFDARHNSFAFSNAVLDARWNAGTVSGRLALQTGDTPDIYYGAEATSDVRHILEATVAWKAPVGKGLTLDGGIFLSPIGPEGILVKDNWNWSRSTLFFGLPFYHAGMRATYPLSQRWNLTGGVYNGWNNVTDTNGKKSVSVQALYTKPDKVTVSLLYFGGAERPRGAPEGEPWRNLFDSHITVNLTNAFSFQAHADAGFENTTFGRSSWRGGAVALRLKANQWLYVAGRADILDETIPNSSAGSASAIFFPTTRVRSLTATLDARPVDRLAARLEFRHDVAADAIYFKGASRAPSAKTQSTLTFGLTAWF